MKTISLLLAGGLLAASFALPVSAERYSYPGVTTGGLQKVAAGAGCPMAMDHSNRMYGRIKELDYNTGSVTLTNQNAELRLSFPPEYIRNLEIGNTLTVEFGFERGIPEVYQ